MVMDVECAADLPQISRRDDTRSTCVLSQSSPGAKYISKRE